MFIIIKRYNCPLQKIRLGAQGPHQSPGLPAAFEWRPVRTERPRGNQSANHRQELFRFGGTPSQPAGQA